MKRIFLIGLLATFLMFGIAFAHEDGATDMVSDGATSINATSAVATTTTTAVATTTEEVQDTPITDTSSDTSSDMANATDSVSSTETTEATTNIEATTNVESENHSTGKEEGETNKEAIKEKFGHIKEVRERVVEKFKEVKDRYEKEVKEYKDVREKWIEARKKLREHRGENETEVEVAKERAKEYVGKGLSVAINKLELIKSFVSKQPSLNETEKANIIAKLDEQIALLKDKQAAIQNATTREELVSNAKEIKDEWGNIKGSAKTALGKVANAKISNLINRAEKAADKVDSIIAKFKDKGYDTTEAEAKLEEFRAKIDKAKQLHEEAKSKYDEADTAKDVDKVVREANSVVKEAAKELKDAYKSLKEAIKDLRKLRANSAANATEVSQ
ncbi:MAG: hypothetical protein D6769_03075 [Methanobacteriota archaeon]|nr:MAG: hypothetical protein D6769_03075 [Euryarchaeota archaeon]